MEHLAQGRPLPHSKLRVNLLIHTHSFGLRRSMGVWKRLLTEAGFNLTVTEFLSDPIHRISRAVRRSRVTLTRRPMYDVNIFYETLHPNWFPAARINCLSPNQEWFPDHQRQLLPRLDCVICKTHYAESLFQRLGCRTAFTGFTTPDRWRPTPEKDFRRVLHVAGLSNQKGTRAINAVWLRHPEWPLLQLFWTAPNASVIPSSNISWTSTYVPEPDLLAVQNASGIQLCPSEAEGFGHYLLEAMSTGAVVLTTDAPPMNEFVTADRGILVSYSRTALRGAGTNYYVDLDALEHAISHALEMDDSSRHALGARAREWYLQNDREAAERVREALLSLC